eukprot:m.63806 g.63806  ORF g.63806 m.63806 type:complete len:395 (-) comp11461_c2_seq2:26-1210(-)
MDVASLLPPELYLVDCEEYSKADDRGVKLGAGEKLVYFIRHGQSMGNVANNEERFSDVCYDAPLTEHGQFQAKKLQQHVDRFGVQAVYSSPLTRALQTSCLAFERTSQPIIAWPTVTEFYPHMPECQGRNREELEKMLLLTSMSRFESVQMHGVHDNWWHAAGDKKTRLSMFFNWLASCPETKVAVVCHWGFINEALKVAGAQNRLELHNCTWVRTIWKTPLSPRVTRPLSHEGDMFSLILAPSGAVTERGMKLLEQFQSFHKGVKSDPSLANTSCLRYSTLPYMLLATFGPMKGQYTIGLVNHAVFTYSDSVSKMLEEEEEEKQEEDGKGNERKPEPKQQQQQQQLYQQQQQQRPRQMSSSSGSSYDFPHRVGTTGIPGRNSVERIDNKESLV